MVMNTEEKALDAYLALLKEKDVPLSVVQVRTQFLKKLTAELIDKIKGRDVYADALNDLVNTFAYDEWQQRITTLICKCWIGSLCQPH